VKILYILWNELNISHLQFEDKKSIKIRRVYIKHIQRFPHLPKEGIASPNYGQIKKMACEIPSTLNGMNKIYNHLG
jgi:hypothetical protein